MDSPESSDSIEIDEIDDNCNYVDNDESDSSQSSNLTLEIDDTLLDSFCYIKGRRYQRSEYITYFFPNDDEEGNEICMNYSFFNKSNFSSPMHEKLMNGNAKVLDLGCGTGRWLLDMAEDYPDSTFVGVDISPFFPDSNETPPNVGFLQCNVNDGLPFPDSTFDFVCQRNMITSVTINEWESFVKEMIRVVKPGGYIEMFEMELINENSSPEFKCIEDLIELGLESTGIVPHLQRSIPPILESIPNLKDIRNETISIPVGNWGGKIGEMVIINLPTFPWGITDEEYNKIGERCSKELKLNHGRYAMSCRWYGRKA
ncbi:12871_t:CDS:2 [Funneliformis mosseae]|uniref:12871_t:CDS:1 n=1 Tax=Funneliformis mosseae TaxID=27381 RepID=A0A9N9FBH2_FUNMO|nr:12871_t:CDS:2 [Funneliformis mosseae]